MSESRLRSGMPIKRERSVTLGNIVALLFGSMMLFGELVIEKCVLI